MDVGAFFVQLKLEKMLKGKPLIKIVEGRWSKVLALFILLFSVSTSCQNNTDRASDTPTSGNINALADATFFPIVQAELDVFHSVYNNAHIRFEFLPESEAFKKLFADSARLLIASRRLSIDERKFFEQKKIYPKEILVGRDAVAFIVNPNNRDTVFDLQQIKDILAGKILSWREVSEDNSNDKLDIVFDHPQSGIVRYMLDSIVGTDSLSPYSHALNSDTSVINYVAHHKNAIGMIGVSWISDRDDSTALSFTDQIKVCAIRPIKNDRSYKPYQAYMALEQYPFIRNIWMISTDPHLGLADGFTSFVASDKGQRIILKAGLLPAIAPLRLVNVRKD